MCIHSISLLQAMQRACQQHADCMHARTADSNHMHTLHWQSHRHGIESVYFAQVPCEYFEVCQSDKDGYRVFHFLLTRTTYSQIKTKVLLLANWWESIRKKIQQFAIAAPSAVWWDGSCCHRLPSNRINLGLWTDKYYSTRKYCMIQTNVEKKQVAVTSQFKILSHNFLRRTNFIWPLIRKLPEIV